MGSQPQNTGTVLDATQGVASARELQIVLEFGRVEKGTYVDKAQVAYVAKFSAQTRTTGGEVNVAFGSRDAHFPLKEEPGNLLMTRSEFCAVVPVDDTMHTTWFELAVEAFAKNVVGWESLGVAKVNYRYDDARGGWYRLVFQSGPDNEKFHIYGKIEPLENRVAKTGNIWVSRQTRESSDLTTYARDDVEVSLLVRGMDDPNADPSFKEQALGSHADMTLPTSTGDHTRLVGFFGGEQLGWQAKVGKKLANAGPLGALALPITAMNMAGYVNVDGTFKTDREHYYYATSALEGNAPTLKANLKVRHSQAKLICDWWDKAIKDCTEWKQRYDANPDTAGKHPLPYRLAGGNCASRAANSLTAGDVLHHVRGIDTPFHVFRTMREIHGNSVRTEAGFAGFDDQGVYRVWSGAELAPYFVEPEAQKCKSNALDAVDDLDEAEDFANNSDDVNAAAKMEDFETHFIDACHAAQACARGLTLSGDNAEANDLTQATNDAIDEYNEYKQGNSTFDKLRAVCNDLANECDQASLAAQNRVNTLTHKPELP